MNVNGLNVAVLEWGESETDTLLKEISESAVVILTIADEECSQFIHAKRQIFYKTNKYMTRIAHSLLISDDTALEKDPSD